jgi:hypothetical protein
VRRVLLLPVLCLLAACSGSSPASPSASVTEPPTSTTTASVEAEVEAAYLRSWEVYAKAVRDLDPSGLEESYADDALTVVLDEIARLKTAGTPVRIRVEHDFNTQITGDSQAIVMDTYVNHSVLLDPSTGEPAEPDPNKLVTDLYAMREIEGAWKVVHFERR